MKDTTGFTIQVVFGSWATPTIQFGNFILLRICLGFVSISFMGADMENYMVNIMKKLKESKLL